MLLDRDGEPLAAAARGPRERHVGAARPDNYGDLPTCWVRFPV
ncbi:MAG TPA: hypothetical protein VGR26_11595 [Acidimicrobiales bacterium]|nr:hypothetical protein [Acidimicrobiales bacterium]